jgi:hypothetical protein
MRPLTSLVMSVVFATIASTDRLSAQTTTQHTEGVCSPAVVSGASVTITCTALTKEQQRMLTQMPALLQQIIRNQISPAVLLKKLEEIKQLQISGPETVARGRYVAALRRAIDDTQTTHDRMHPVLVTLQTAFDRGDSARFLAHVKQMPLPEIESLAPLVNDAELTPQSINIRESLDGLRREMRDVAQGVASGIHGPKLVLFLYRTYRERLIKSVAVTLCQEATRLSPDFKGPSLCAP